MKNLFNLSINTRKSVKGTLLFSATAISKTGSEIGQLEIKILNEESYYSLFLRYTPKESCDPLETITTLKLAGRDENEIREILEAFPEVLLEMMSKATKENANILVAMMMLSMCIIPSTNSVIIPETLGVKITSSLISRIIGNEWLGIEVKMLPEIQEKLSYLANEKKNA